jgi:uncharacterized damage-inducible protein DinB
MSSLFPSPDPSFLATLVRGEAGFTRPGPALEGLTDEQAHAKPHGLSHSIAEIVAHMLYYQDLANRIADGADFFMPSSAAPGWPAVEKGSWNELCARYLAAIETGEQVVGKAADLHRRLLPEGAEFFGLERHSAGSLMADIAVHNAHHLGQVITIRQLLGAWPPPQGGMTW